MWDYLFGYFYRVFVTTKRMDGLNWGPRGWTDGAEAQVGVPTDEKHISTATDENKLTSGEPKLRTKIRG